MNIPEKITNICCIGAGYVGGPTMSVIAQKCPHITVNVVDINPNRIADWNNPNLEKLPVFEPGLSNVIAETRGKNLFCSTDIEKGIRDAQMIFISVNTPTKTYGIGKGMAADLKYVELCARQIAEVATEDKIVVEKSTLPVRTAQAIRTILTNNSNNIRFSVLSNPEFLAEGTAINDLHFADRILIGSEDDEDGKIAEQKLVDIYANWIPRERIITTRIWSSELSKLTANAFLAQRISSINSISALCEKNGADVDEVAFVIGKDRRIGPKFLKASIGFGGSCFKKDILNLSYLCGYYGLPEVAAYWDSVVQINEWQTHRIVTRMLEKMFNTIAGKRIAVFGFAFKADTGDTRESPANLVVRDLLAEHALPVVTDPKAIHDAKRDLKDVLDKVIFEEDAYKAAEGAHAVVVCTEWKCFAALDWKRIYKSMAKPAFVFDGRNILDAAALRKIGFDVVCVGKGDSEG